MKIKIEISNKGLYFTCLIAFSLLAAIGLITGGINSLLLVVGGMLCGVFGLLAFLSELFDNPPSEKK